jgi:hypothetical protein
MDRASELRAGGSIPQSLQNYVFEGFLPSAFSPKGAEGETITF